MRHCWIGLAATGTDRPRGGESPFGDIYTTDTHPKGSFEFEQWMTMRTGKVQGDYRLGQYRSEVEYGVTDRFQASLYWNTYSINAFGSDAAGETAGPYIPENFDKSQRYRRGLSHDGWSAEFIYRVLSPYTDPVGLALYLEPSFGKFKNQLESKLILQKNYFDERLVLAYNLTLAPEWEKKSGDPTAIRIPRSSAPERKRLLNSCTRLARPTASRRAGSPGWKRVTTTNTRATA